ncbi:M16 family metallopeptidase [Rhodovulum adriaticum]|uniref:Zinc protease n=1 Tax=Rhodovulum adriaticum TaxID=35804 RepID=A0A4R2NYG7_RHOAD|nr:pitrilysin family protein [Rhodovulum adriaticum]MBK1634295.1 peptidase M16 [Rhodovulum adriaticum]TCP27152.1 zinc protease [Rhodovulum adriaticum]
MRRLRNLLVLLLIWAGPATADRVTDFTLDNGLQVVVIEDHRAPVTVNMVWYRVGAADEPPGVSGIAHFLEHLMFKGTDEVAPGAFSRIVKAQGGSDNAFTSWDYTAYFQRVAADRLDLMMQLEADRMTDLRLAGPDVETERDVILEERNQRTDNDPGALFREQMRAALYLNHPYGIPIIGWRHEMETLSKADALAFYDTYYAPNNAILVVAGDVTPDAVRDMAQTHFGGLAPSDALPARVRPQEPPHLAERRVMFEDPRVAQPYLMRSYLAPERDSGDQGRAAALTYLAELLGGEGATSFLGERLQFERQVALYTGASYGGLSLDDTAFNLFVVPAPGVSLETAEDALDKALAAFLREGVDPALFDSLKSQLLAAEIYARDNIQGLARRYGRALTSGLTIEDVQAWPDVLQAVKPEDVMAAAHDLLKGGNAVTGWLSRPVAEVTEVTQ